jgi:hypothetical protein
VVRFTVEAGRSWIANIQKGDGYRSALWRWEAADVAIAVAAGDAFLVHPSSPSRWRFLAHLATSVLVSDDDLRAFIATYTDIVAFDAAGERLWTRRVALDGVELDRCSNGILAGRACFDPPEDWRPFRVSANNGADA